MNDFYNSNISDLGMYDQQNEVCYDPYVDGVGYSPKNEKIPVVDPQFCFDPVVLCNLGFSEFEIQLLAACVGTYGKVTTNSLVNNFGATYEIAKRVYYAYSICIGKVTIENIDEISKHLRKMNSHIPRIGIQNLSVSKITTVPRKALVAGIPKGIFDKLNSKQYPHKERMYDVVDVTGGRIWIKTDRKPVIPWGTPKFIEGVLEVKELVNNNKEVIIAIDKDYARLCNRFIIVASLKRPEYHHGMVELICIEGTKVYVYAQSMGIRDTAKYNMGTQRVYSYGFYSEEIIPKLVESANALYDHLGGQHYVEIPANQDFTILLPEKDDNEDTDDTSGIEE